MDLNGKSRHRIAAFISARPEAETKPKEGPTLSQRISKKAAEPGPDSKGSRNKTGNTPRITLPASGREEEPRTYSWKDPTETGEFSSTWTDPEPFITTERHMQNYPTFSGNTFRILKRTKTVDMPRVPLLVLLQSAWIQTKVRPYSNYNPPIVLNRH